MEYKMIHVGKNGVTPELLGELKILLKKYKNVKVKFLKAAREDADRKEISSEILKHVKVRESELRGNILTLNL